MDKRPFSDKSVRPTEELLKNILGEVYKLFDELDRISIQFKKDWNFSKSSGWMQKVYNKKKALYYFIPLNDSFLISLTLREHEKTEFITDVDLSELHDQLKSAKKYSEGYALKFSIKDRKSFLQFVKLIERIIEKRE